MHGSTTNAPFPAPVLRASPPLTPIGDPTQDDHEPATYAELVAEATALVPAFGPLAAAIGHTPLVPVPGPHRGARVVAKVEGENPAGSVKDRVAAAMVARALVRSGTLEHLRLIEYSGGNLARALGRQARALGLDIELFLSSGSPASLLTDLAADGAAVTLVDARRGFRAVIEDAVERARADPRFTLLYQHRNPANLGVHEQTTGPEISAALGSHAPAAWVASIGTGGTLVGVARALRRATPGILVVGVTPEEMPYATPLPPDPRPRYAGSGGLGDGVRQPFVELGGVDLHLHVSYRCALWGMGELLRTTGLRVGSSAAANWLAACSVARRLDPDQTVVTIFPCNGTPEEWEAVP